MNLLFVHDNKFLYKQGLYYSNGFSEDVWQRYLSVFGHITVCGRQIDVADGSPIADKLSSCDRVSFANIKNKNAIAIAFTPADYRHIHELVKKSDAVIARLDSVIGFIALKYARKERKPAIIELVTDPWDCYWNYGFRGKVLAPFITGLTKWNALHSKWIIYVTDRYLQEKYPSKGAAINISNVACVPDEAAFQKKQIRYTKIFADDMKIILGTAGALLPFKGQQFVIKALAHLKKYGMTKFEYWLAGDGDEDSLRRLATALNVIDEVKFLGRLNHDSMSDFYKKVDIYIQPSLQEGLPRSVIEAMSVGCCCLGARTAGIPELLEPERIFEKRNVKQIISMLRECNEKMCKDSSAKNFELSRCYKYERLFAKRKAFLIDFVNHIEYDK